MQKVLQFIQKPENVPAVSEHGIMFMQNKYTTTRKIDQGKSALNVY